MAAKRSSAGRKGPRKSLTAVALVAAFGGILFATEAPEGLIPGIGGSVALAELAARSPGVRVGGVALKAKKPRMAALPVGEGDDAPAGLGPETPLANVLGTSAGPEGAVPGVGPFGPGGFPTDITNPGSSVPGAPVDQTGGVPGGPGGPGFGGVFTPPIGGGGGGGGVIVTPPNPNPNPEPEGPGPVTPIPGVPEPATWLTMIMGFGLVGHALRRRRRAAFV